MKKQALRLGRTTLQHLSGARVAEVRGGMEAHNGTKTCPTVSCFTCNTNCCLLEPGTDV